ncbi:hypothetical protein GGF43_003239, partial [Coemansia sp. RSA 2618]
MVITSGIDGPANTPNAGHINDTRADAQQPETGRRPTVCRFFSQPQGCRFGADCRFLHIAAPSPEAQPSKRTGKDRRPQLVAHDSDDNVGSRGRGRGRGSKARGRQSATTTRKRQIEDLLKAPQWTVKRLASDRGESALAVEMKPSDPDFPYDVPRLYLALVVPTQYPARHLSDAVLTIQVANQKIPTGVKRNIELAFSKHVRKAANAAIEAGDVDSAPTLEDHLVWLDRNLEQLMQQKPAATIKFMSNAGPAKDELPEKAPDAGKDNESSGSVTPVVSIPNTTAAQRASRPVVSRPVVRPAANTSSNSASGASSGDSRRTLELRQLERRFRSSFARLQDAPDSGTVIKLDIVPTDPDIHSFDIFQLTGKLAVARTYPLADGQTPSVALSLDADSIVGRKDRASSWQPVGGRARYLDYIGRCFAEHVVKSPEVSLLQLLNWLDRRLVSMVSSPPPENPSDSARQPSILEQQQPLVSEQQPPISEQGETTTASQNTQKGWMFDEPEEKPWIRRITPAKAGLPGNMDGLAIETQGSGGSDTETSDFDSSSASDSDAEQALESGPFAKPARRGIEIRLGMVSMTNVTLMHCHSLSLSVRCTRCKGMVELKGIAPTLRAEQDRQVWKACDTCSTIVGVRFRPDWMFAGTTTIGFLDCSGCAPSDLLPSKFTLSCEACSMNDLDIDDDNDDGTAKRASDTLGAVGVAANTTFNCRVCYTRMAVQLQEPQF